eukprot:7614899-Pyramimonas_sp.AAC.2
MTPAMTHASALETNRGAEPEGRLGRERWWTAGQMKGEKWRMMQVSPGKRLLDGAQHAPQRLGELLAGAVQLC